MKKWDADQPDTTKQWWEKKANEYKCIPASAGREFQGFTHCLNEYNLSPTPPHLNQLEHAVTELLTALQRGAPGSPKPIFKDPIRHRLAAAAPALANLRSMTGPKTSTTENLELALKNLMASFGVQVVARPAAYDV